MNTCTKDIDGKIHELMLNLGDEVRDEYTGITKVVTDKILEIPDGVDAGTMISLILNDVDVKYLPIIAAIVASSFIEQQPKPDKEVMLYHNLFLYLIDDDLESDLHMH